MSLAALDTGAVSRALSHYAERSRDRVEAFFERAAVAELSPQATHSRVLRHDEGLAVRLVRGERAWLSSCDVIDGQGLAEALRRTARVHPRTAPPVPELGIGRWQEPPAWSDLETLPGRLERAIRREHAAFELSVTVREHRREVLVVGPQVAGTVQREHYHSCRIELPWGKWGTLLPTLGEAEVDRLARVLTRWFRSRAAPSPERGRYRVLLGPAAVAVLLHEAVAHALEADTLAATGEPEAAIGLQLSVPGISVLDDPAAGPVPRNTDDEGTPVLRRWLLRHGIVAQLLADRSWSDRGEQLLPGAARRAHRHAHPGPRSTYLEMPPGVATEEELLAATGDGLYLSEASRGSLDPISGRFELRFRCGRRVRQGTVAEPVGACRIAGGVGDLLADVVAVGRTCESGGAGWCAKGGQMLPVWASCPGLVFERVEVLP